MNLPQMNLPQMNKEMCSQTAAAVKTCSVAHSVSASAKGNGFDEITRIDGGVTKSTGSGNLSGSYRAWLHSLVGRCKTATARNSSQFGHPTED
jgi:hypothetical protein